MLVPGYGPVRFLADRYQHPLPSGFWLDAVLNAVQSGGAQKDIFPSLHTAGPVFLSLFSFRHRDKMPFKYTWPFVAFFSANIVIATMFLRWHYLIDVLAGIALSSGAFLLAGIISRREIDHREQNGLQPVWVPHRAARLGSTGRRPRAELTDDNGPSRRRFDDDRRGLSLCGRRGGHQKGGTTRSRARRRRRTGVGGGALHDQHRARCTRRGGGRARCVAARVRAILANSGCANACTGAAGLASARETTAAVARALGADPGDVLPASTGVIGALLPSARLVELAPALAPISRRTAPTASPRRS